jgi:N-acyl-D-aspartate/D-glutamate deacylase
MRSEGQTEPEAVAEALRIGREANLPVEIFHLKVSGKTRWGNMVKIVGQIQAARDAGQDVTANMYPYIAGGTALAASLPPWVADGGLEKLLQRLREPATRVRIEAEMADDHPEWENIFFDSGGGAGVMVSGVENPELKKFNGKTIEEIARAQNKSELDTLFDFVIADKGQTGALYFMANENDLVYGLKQPWTSLCLDAGELSLDGPLYEPHIHPRAFGAMPRFLGYYVRDQKILPLEQGIRKMTSLPAQRERLVNRGLLKVGYFADVTLFDPKTIQDVATYTASSQLSKGVKYGFREWTVGVRGWQIDWGYGRPGLAWARMETGSDRKPLTPPQRFSFQVVNRLNYARWPPRKRFEGEAAGICASNPETPAFLHRSLQIASRSACPAVPPRCFDQGLAG